jgi:large subunit ribosomal protein L16
MMQPRKVKWRKQHLPRVRSKVASSGNKLEFGEYGLKSLEFGRIFSNQIEAMRVAVVRGAGKKAKFWIRIFP